MSVWASVCGEGPIVYDGGYGDTVPDDGFLDVAVSCRSGRVRILVESEGEVACLSLDVDGVLEMQRRLTEALARIEAR